MGVQYRTFKAWHALFLLAGGLPSDKNEVMCGAELLCAELLFARFSDAPPSLAKSLLKEEERSCSFRNEVGAA